MTDAINGRYPLPHLLRDKNPGKLCMCVRTITNYFLYSFVSMILKFLIYVFIGLQELVSIYFFHIRAMLVPIKLRHIVI